MSFEGPPAENDDKKGELETPISQKPKEAVEQTFKMSLEDQLEMSARESRDKALAMSSEERERRRKKIMEMGGWSTSGTAGLSEDSEKYYWQYNSMNGTVVFSDGKDTWYRKNDDKPEEALEQQGMTQNMDMFCPTPDIVFGVMQGRR